MPAARPDAGGVARSVIDGAPAGEAPATGDPDQACLRALDSGAVAYQRVPGAGGMRTPLEIDGPIGRVALVARGRRSAVMDCVLARALLQAGGIFDELGITALAFSAAFDNRTRRGSNEPSAHAYGLAIDVHVIRGAFGEYDVRQRFERGVGLWRGLRKDAGLLEACIGQPATKEGRLLRQLACRLKLHPAFRVIVTPDDDADHQDHLHLEAGSTFFPPPAHAPPVGLPPKGQPPAGAKAAPGPAPTERPPTRRKRTKKRRPHPKRNKRSKTAPKATLKVTLKNGMTPPSAAANVNDSYPDGRRRVSGRTGFRFVKIYDQGSTPKSARNFRERILAHMKQPSLTSQKLTPGAAPADRALSRRRFVGGAAALLGSAGLLRAKASWAAEEGPETPDMKFGMIALTDCSPIVIAHEKGLFKKYGINSTVSKGASWAAIRDSLSNGDIQATHMLTGMPIASTMGLLGSPKKPMIIPWMLNRNGQSISLANSLKGKVQADPKALRPIALEAKEKGTPLTFAMTFPPGTHAMWIRYWLAAGGINPDKDVSLIVVPPAQMVANMKVGKMDGFCVGEPWNARTIADGIGYTAINTQDIWKDHPEKVCAFTAEFAEKNPRTVKAVLKALHEASVWLDDMKNRPEQAELVSKATYINCTKELILGRMQGHYDFGDGRKKEDPNYMIFSSRNCNFPQPKFAIWWLTQFRRWGMVPSAPDYKGVAKEVMRHDIYEAAMKEIGVKHGGLDNKPEKLFDGVVYDPAKPEEYAKSFSISSLKA